MERSRTVSSGNDDVPLISHDHTSYDSGDVAMQNVDDTLYSPPMVTSPEIVDTKNGFYTSLRTPSSTFSVEEPPDQPKHHHHVKRFDHNEARRTLLKTGLSKLFITLFFSAAICVTLKSWQGFRDRVVLSNKDVRIFNSLTIGLSICLGLNILASLKHYASVLRWSFLTRRYVSLEVFDLILHLSSLAKVTKLMVISSPGFRGKTWLRKFKWFKDVRDDGTKWMWLACLVWLTINIGSQILVALLSLFWPMSNSEIPLLSPGSVTVADLSVWDLGDNQTFADYDDPNRLINESSLDAAWRFGIEAMAYPELNLSQIQNDLSGLPGTPVYKDGSAYLYRFFNREPTHQYTNYLASSRNVTARATCEKLEVKTGDVVSSGKEYEEFENMYLEARQPGTKAWDKFVIFEFAPGSITWMPSVWEYCGPRCTNFVVMQYGLTKRVTNTTLFLCNSTVDAVTHATAKDDIITLTHNDTAAVYGNDDFARTAAGAIGWTGIPWYGRRDRQSRSYSLGSKWSPAENMTAARIEDLLMRFTIGAIAAFDDHGIRYHIPGQFVVPSQGQQLDVDWPYIFAILGGICFIQFSALCLLVLFANRTIVRDDSFFSMAMLLSPVVGRIGAKGMTLSGEEIKDHPKLRWKKIRYDYREGEDGKPNLVDIFFEGKDQRESRRSWAPGSYS